MKKIFTLISLFLITQLLSGQSVLYQDFGANIMPPVGWSVEGNNNWRISNSANAGGVAPEGKLTWTPQFVGMSRLISPQVNLSGAEKALLTFKYMIDHYSGNYQIGVATRSNNGPWNQAYVQTVTSNISARDMVIVIDNSDVGSSSFQFCLFFNGNSYNLNDWYFDNIELLIPAELDLAMVSIDVPSYFVDPQDVTGKVANMGLQPISSFDLNWQLDEDEIFTKSYSGLNLAIGEEYNYLSDHVLNPDPGSYNLKVWVSNINNLGVDDVPENDLLEKIIGIPTQTVTRKPLFEEFTSSTCAPCATFNNNVFNAFTQQNADIITLIKYQMNWPGSGDPYYTAEGGVRRNYYGVSGVPSLFTDGRSTPTTAGGVNAALNTSLATPAFVVIEGQHIIEGTMVTAQANITSYVDLHNLTLHMVVIEKLTTGNVGTNGETSFKHVMMKMIPDAYGSNVSVESGVPHKLTLSVDMNGTFVEEMDDLKVVIFLQDDVTKNIFQSAYSLEVGAFIAFDPEPGSIDHFTDIDLYINFSQAVYMLGGSEITNDNVGSILSLVDSQGNAFPFTASINSDKTEIMVDPEGLLDSFTTYYLTVEAVENMLGVPTPITTNHFTTGIHVGLDELRPTLLNIYPNPATNAVKVNFNLGQAGNTSIGLYDISGKQLQTFELGYRKSGNHSFTFEPGLDLPAGVYVVKLKTPESTQSTRLLIKRN
jgi:hypothetical protein